MRDHVEEALEENPVIAAVKDDKGLEEAIQTDCTIIFILNSDIINVGEIVEKVKTHGKLAFVHIDLLEGTSNKEVSLQFLKENTQADGIISTKAQMVRAAKNYGFYTVHRFFLVDSISFKSIDKQIANSSPHFIEILPGMMPKAIGWVKDKVHIPIIASGLVCEKEDVVEAIKAGAVAISSTNNEVWYM
ncbi:glycerol-3-phosphate responsive antiterminator [Halobacillus sp. ACCC02827]|uniref:glycerol-3-phosphate responsive antiterminator n=1 Tax=Bacillaceae TaxID=186817 RepID=UPI0002A4DA2A|nr:MULTISPECIES: glycerol-3-phosphate responsive antiterminator [Bacillaceae]ELK45673.1 glycerol-3-phosphate responsive antiterminator GlpP [Halobacillus sp. BAB-2008]QHT46200.1 glycerol-3-phosphate responsive antiterminator [Bacillus sp. SB49]WJE17017.1 glycerol-3-phosphate responsive antiterminator [Halobacillus sp. ACCC02827]